MAKKTNDFNSVIKHKGKEYNLVFNLNVMEDIQNEYGSFEAWGKLIQGDGEPKAKDIKYGFTAALNEGIDMYNEDHAQDDDFVKREFLTEKQVGRIISEIGLFEAAAKIRESVVESTKSDEKN